MPIAHSALPNPEYSRFIPDTGWAPTRAGFPLERRGRKCIIVQSVNESPWGSKSAAIVVGFVAMIGLLVLLRWGTPEIRAEGIGTSPLSPEAETPGASLETSGGVEVVLPQSRRRTVQSTAEVRPAAEGWVVDADGAAISEAVTWIGSESVDVDDAGHFTWWFLPEGSTAPRLEVRAPGYRSRTVEARPTCAVVALQRAMVREVEVWDPEAERPISGAELRVYAGTGGWWNWARPEIGEPRFVQSTDGEGLATIDAEFDLGELALGVRPPGGEERLFRGSLLTYREDVPRRLEVRPLRPLRVRVERAGRPVSGVVVHARDSGPNNGLRFTSAITGVSGLATLELGGGRLALLIEGRGLHWRHDPELEPWPDEILVEVPDETGVGGRLTFADGTDLAAVEVGLEPGGRRDNRRGVAVEWTRPEADGSWRLEPEGFAQRWSLFLRFDPGGHPQQVSSFAGALAPDVEVPATCLLEVGVVPPERVSVDELEVRVERFAGYRFATLLIPDDDGLRRARVPHGKYELVVTAPGGFSCEVDVPADLPRERIELDLSRRTLEGKVTYGGEPARGVPLRVVVSSEGGWDEYRVTTDGAGGYRLFGLPPGELQLGLRETDSVHLLGKDRVWRRTWFDLPPGTERFDIELETAWLTVETRGGGRFEGPDRIVLCRCPNGTTGGRTRLPGDLEAPPGPIVREWSVEGPTSFRCRPGPGEWVVCYLGAKGLVTEQVIVLEPGAEEYVVFDRGRAESTFMFASGK